MMKRLILFFAVALLATPLLAQTPPVEDRPPELQQYPPQVDWTEIGRWGDRVVISGEGHKDGGDLLYSMAMDPPALDNDRWYITVWGPSNDPATQALVKAFETDPSLSPFIAEPPDSHGVAHKPWSHFNWFRSDDPMQKWRFERYKIAGGPFPVVTIQPPTNGHFGNPKIIVDRIDPVGMQGGPKVIGNRIRASVNLYCKKLTDSGFQPPREATEDFYEGETPPQLSARSRGSHSQTPPWGPVNPPPAQPINPQWPINGPAADTTPLVPPVLTPNLDSKLTQVLSSPTFYLIIIAVLRLWETLGPVFGFKGTLAALLRDLLTKNPPAPAPAPGPLPAPNPNGPLTVYVPDGKGGYTPVLINPPATPPSAT